MDEKTAVYLRDNGYVQTAELEWTNSVHAVRVEGDQMVEIPTTEYARDFYHFSYPPQTEADVRFTLKR